MYNPAEIPSCSLPIFRRAISKYEHLWYIRDAMHFCRALCQLAAVDTITPAEYAAAAKVAEGEIWPVPDQVYTVEQWNKDGTLSAIPGQEVSKEVFFDQFEVLPPFRLPRCARTAGYETGFQVSEAACDDVMTNRTLYDTYGKRGGKYYYIGLLPAASNDDSRYYDPTWRNL